VPDGGAILHDAAMAAFRDIVSFEAQTEAVLGFRPAPRVAAPVPVPPKRSRRKPRRRGTAGDPQFFESAVTLYAELLEAYDADKPPTRLDLADALQISRTTLWRTLKDQEKEFSDIQREPRLK